MIPKTQLRIGNHVDYENTTHVIKELHSDKVLHTWINSDLDGYYSTYEEINPIPLTPEIIEQFGFVQHKTSNQYWSHFILETGWHISQWVADEPMADFEEKGKFYWGDSYIKIEHVHQLQNLYFALTGKEIDNL